MSFDSFQASGNSPGSHAQSRAAIPGFGIVGCAVARRLITGGKVPGLELAFNLDRPSCGTDLLDDIQKYLVVEAV